MHGQLDENREELLELSRQARAVYMQSLDTARAAEMPLPVFPTVQPPAPPPEPAQKSAPSKNPPKNSRLSEKNREALLRFATKPQKVRFLMSQGLSVDEVARELEIGKVEVQLIADLDKS
jgi:hypothetical protein